MNKTQASAFVPHEAHRAMTTRDAKVFRDAAEMYAHPFIRRALLEAGGDTAHVSHFGREKCAGRPIMPWAADREHEAVVAALREVGEALG